MSAFLQTMLANRLPTPLTSVRAYMILFLPSTFVLSRLCDKEDMSVIVVLESFERSSVLTARCARIARKGRGQRAT